MPLYEYLCGQCGSRFTLLQSMSAGREGYTCPQCGAVSTRRVMSTFAQCGGETRSGSESCGPAGSPFR